MSVPTFRQILDSEIDPESPLTSELFFALRDNFLAVLEIDSTDPAPVFQIPLTQVVRGWDGTTNLSATNWAIPPGKYLFKVIGEYNSDSGGDPADLIIITIVEGVCEIKSGGHFTNTFWTNYEPSISYHKRDGNASVGFKCGATGNITLAITATGFNVSWTGNGDYINLTFIGTPVS